MKTTLLKLYFHMKLQPPLSVALVLLPPHKFARRKTAMLILLVTKF